MLAWVERNSVDSFTCGVREVCGPMEIQPPLVRYGAVAASSKESAGPARRLRGWTSHLRLLLQSVLESLSQNLLLARHGS